MPQEDLLCRQAGNIDVAVTQQSATKHALLASRDRYKHEASALTARSITSNSNMKLSLRPTSQNTEPMCTHHGNEHGAVMPAHLLDVPAGHHAKLSCQCASKSID